MNKLVNIFRAQPISAAAVTIWLLLMAFALVDTLAHHRMAAAFAN